MKLISLNCRGLASPSKHLSLQRLLELSQPDVVLLQETLGEEEVVIPDAGKDSKKVGLSLDQMLLVAREGWQWDGTQKR
jgi:exonuclease III